MSSSPDPLEQHERASGAPFVPSSGAPATHTGRPAQHSGAYVPATVRWIMCPHRISAAGAVRQQCPFSSQLREPIADHLANEHGYQKLAIGFYLNHPWFADEPRRDWVARTAKLRVRLAENDDEFCDHPNGYSVNGCPCGATAPDETLMARFLSPDISTEQIMADVTEGGNVHKFNPQELEAALTQWWMDKAEEETRAVVPKAVEYGATDLRDIGRDLADCMGRKVTDEEATELGIFFYLRGKLSRWVDAIKRGDRPSDDTIYDIGVYCRMAQRNRDVGGWPLPPKD